MNPASANLPEFPSWRESATGIPTPGYLAGQFHTHLATLGLQEWKVFTDGGLRFLAVADRYLKEMECSEAKWTPLAGHTTCACDFSDLTRDEGGKLQAFSTGCLLLPKWQVAIARWLVYCYGVEFTTPIHFCAARTLADLQRFRDALHVCWRKGQKAEWQIHWGGGPPTFVARADGLTWDSLVLAADLRDRIDRETAGFFAEPTVAMYRRLGLAHRRGILLWGPPGNGKTSIAQVVASMNPQLAALCLQPGADFDDTSLRLLIGAWQDQAPALLLIEDLDWMLRHTSVATFLNLLDGIDQHTHNGMLLIATTNHPEKLDRAITTRPGRFDAVLEVPCPTRELRERYFAKHLPEAGTAAQAQIAANTGDLSFAHLREVLLAGGHYALRDGRAQRTLADLSAAANIVRETVRTADDEFAGSGHAGFGFGEKGPM